MNSEQLSPDTITYHLLFKSRKSRVYRVYCPSGHLAVKVLYKVALSNRKITQFYKEFDLIQDIAHPCIRKLFDTCLIDDKHAIPLEWEDGITLEKCGKIKSQIVLLKSVWDIVDAVAAIHAESFIRAKGVDSGPNVTVCLPACIA